MTLSLQKAILDHLTIAPIGLEALSHVPTDADYTTGAFQLPNGFFPDMTTLLWKTKIGIPPFTPERGKYPMGLSNPTYPPHPQNNGDNGRGGGSTSKDDLLKYLRDKDDKQNKREEERRDKEEGRRDKESTDGRSHLYFHRDTITMDAAVGVKVDEGKSLIAHLRNVSDDYSKGILTSTAKTGHVLVFRINLKENRGMRVSLKDAKEVSVETFMNNPDVTKPMTIQIFSEKEVQVTTSFLDDENNGE